MDSGYTELDRPICRFCRKKTSLTVVSRKRLTRKVLADRLKVTTDNMMRNLEAAFQLLPTVDKDVFGSGVDPELEMLKLMSKAKELRDNVQSPGIWTKPGPDKQGNVQSSGPRGRPKQNRDK